MFAVAMLSHRQQWPWQELELRVPLITIACTLPSACGYCNRRWYMRTF